MTFYLDYNLSLPNLNGTFNYTGINFGNNFNPNIIQGFSGFGSVGGFGNFGGSFNPGFDTFSIGTTASSTSKETMEILEEINKTLDTYYNDSNDNVRRMRAN